MIPKENRTLLLCLLVLMSFENLAQDVVQSQQVGANIHDHLLIKAARSLVEQGTNESYEGSPYFSDVFEAASVQTKSQHFVPVKMRYLITEDIMEFQDGSGAYILDPLPGIEMIAMGAHKFVVAGHKEPGFYELHVSGELSLVSKSIVNFRPRNDITGVPAKYSKQADIYYIMLPDKSVDRLSSLKELTARMPEYKDKITEFAKTHKISLKNRTDLISLFEYCNDLLVRN